MDIFCDNAFAGKTIFVAGGSSGINLGIAMRFGAMGARVALISRSEDRIAAAAESVRGTGAEAVGIAADVRDYDAVASAFAQVAEKWGAIDTVVSGAAGNFLSPAIGLSANAFRTVIEIDLIGTFNVLRASWDHLRKPGASLISISAGQAKRAIPFQAHASAAKAGINNLTETLAMEWGPAGVRVNAISPGPIGDTEGMARLAPTDEETAAIKRRIPLRDYGTKRDIADAALFLASDNARYITGVTLEVDGGLLLGDASADALTLPERSR
ncbi:SDR family oxidoreductase [Sphingosinithalassobacter portus]|uniref:SDR family oxidoreductase n=1 Tax=Stakelama portus TaxID=2676234 RepID=UPI000D6E9242|nr:SDR family oxidoreductase [Sphingosinithalassobacter portus]